MTYADSITRPEPNRGAISANNSPDEPAHRALISEVELPKTSRIWLRWFLWLADRHVRKNFHSVRISRSGCLCGDLAGPLVIYSNHASWWDPLVGAVLLTEFFPGRAPFAPIAAAALEKYQFFRKLGFFGVQQGSRRGAIQFLKTAEALLQHPNHILWVTPQGRFADARERPPRFEAGLGHLPSRISSARFVPLAIEYVFWEEKLPEVLVRFGEPEHLQNDSSERRPAMEWTRQFESRLQDNQDVLALESTRRDPDAFTCLQRNRTGIGGAYDLWRNVRSRLRGDSFAPEHGTK